MRLSKILKLVIAFTVIFFCSCTKKLNLGIEDLRDKKSKFTGIYIGEISARRSQSVSSQTYFYTKPTSTKNRR